VEDCATWLCNAGVTPTITHDPKSRRWTLSITTDRIHATAVYGTGFNSNRIKQINSTLTVDGQKRAPACCGEHLAEIISKPGGKDRPAEPDPLPAPADPTTAPPYLRHQYGILTAKLGRRQPGATVTIARADPRRWVLGVDYPDGQHTHIRLYSERVGQEWKLARHRPFQVIRDGVDRTYEAKGRLEEAVRLLLDKERPDTPGAIGHSAPAWANTGLTVRRTTVIRV